MTSCLACLTIQIEPFLQLGDRRIGADKDGVSHAPNQREGIGACEGDSDGRIRLLERFGHNGDVSEAEIAAFVGEFFCYPRLHNDVQGFKEAAATLAVGYIISLVILGQSASSYPEIKAALADMVHRRGLLCHTQRIGQGQNLHG
jgi:hypothetical protein